RYAKALAAYRASPATLTEAELAELNRVLRQSEQQLAPPQGLPRRPWYRHLLHAPDHRTGEPLKTLPAVREAIERQQWADVEPAVAAVARAIRNYASEAGRAAELLEQALRQGRKPKQHD